MLRPVFASSGAGYRCQGEGVGQWMREGRPADKDKQVGVTVMSPKGEEEKGQVGKRTGHRQASVFRHLGESYPPQGRKALGT